MRATPLLGRRAPLTATVLGAVVLATGCGVSDPGGTNADGSPFVKVIATTTQLGDIVREVGGPNVRVTQILKPNTDPHDYEPRPRDVQETAGAKVVFVSGDNLDRWMGDVVEQGGGDATTVDLAAALPQRLPGEQEGSEASEYDPHWWHDPRNVEAAVAEIRDALVKAEPSARQRIDAGAARYLAKVKALDAGIRRCMAQVPAAERKLVTDHDAFGYFARRYGITVVGAVIPSQSTQAQPSASGISDLAKVIRAEGVKAVFPESSVNPRLAKAIAAQTGATAELTLYGDTLGPEGSSGDTYLKMERANADAMLEGFTGGRQGCTIAGL
jgi:ABC-type Zn uptake system ZnuABC Zn-binding protein ZnuA